MSMKTLTIPLNTPHLDALRDEINNGALILLSTLAITALLAAITRQVYFFTRYRDPAVRRLAKHKATVEFKANVKIKEISPQGWIKIAPGDREWWKLLTRTKQLDNILKIPTRIKIADQRVQISKKLPNSAATPGKITYDQNKDILTIGRNTQTGEKTHLQLRKASNILVAGLPGTGKTVLLKGIMNAVRPDAHVTYFHGAIETEQAITDALEGLENLKQQRLKDGIDYWNGKTKHRRLEIFILDESQQYFKAKNTKNTATPPPDAKATKAANIMKNCHQAGIIVTIATADITPTAIPAPIRNQTNTKICTNVHTIDQAQLILGRKPTKTDPKPIKLPPGRMIISDSNQNWEQFDIYNSDKPLE
ncbi:ATP-binding protein [Corynebacterium kefirresidentii]|uniref:ATP-binding protein n=1 Tax=Corynebacterium kefirresidentii TaxID=1979527 RepID=UPI0038CFD095